MPLPKPKTNGKPHTRPQPKLVNRGAGGLLTKITDDDKKAMGIDWDEKVVRAADKIIQDAKSVAKYRIAPELSHMAVGIDSVLPDPMNARLHPERNMEAIKQSLTTYGQVKPIVVRRENSTIIAGNGTHAAAKALGWDEIAVHFVDMSHVEATGFGLADNRTAELADWDYKVVKACDRIIQEAGHPTTGWSDDELTVLRATVWQPAAVTGEQFEQNAETKIPFTREQMETIEIAVGMIREREGDKKLSEGACLKIVCDEWFPKPSYERDE